MDLHIIIFSMHFVPLLDDWHTAITVRSRVSRLHSGFRFPMCTTFGTKYIVGVSGYLVNIVYSYRHYPFCDRSIVVSSAGQGNCLKPHDDLHSRVEYVSQLGSSALSLDRTYKSIFNPGKMNGINIVEVTTLRLR